MLRRESRRDSRGPRAGKSGTWRRRTVTQDRRGNLRLFLSLLQEILLFFSQLLASPSKINPYRLSYLVIFFLIIIIERIPSAAKQSWNLCRTWGVLLSRRRNRSSLLPCSRRVLSWPPEWAWRERLLSYTLQFEHISLKFAA